MAWLDCRVAAQFNRTAFLKLDDGTEAEIKFAHRGVRLISESDAVTGLDMERQMMTIATPSDLTFKLRSTIRVGDSFYIVQSVQDEEPQDQNGRWRAKAKRVQVVSMLRSL